MFKKYCHNLTGVGERERLCDFIERYTAFSRKVVGKSARDHPERYFRLFCFPSSSSRKFERVAR